MPVVNKDFQSLSDLFIRPPKQPVGLAVETIGEVEGVGVSVATPGPEVEGPKRPPGVLPMPTSIGIVPSNVPLSADKLYFLLADPQGMQHSSICKK
jgi:hypothetical protein